MTILFYLFFLFIFDKFRVSSNLLIVFVTIDIRNSDNLLFGQDFRFNIVIFE